MKPQNNPDNSSVNPFEYYGYSRPVNPIDKLDIALRQETPDSINTLSYEATQLASSEINQPLRANEIGQGIVDAASSVSEQQPSLSTPDSSVIEQLGTLGDLRVIGHNLEVIRIDKTTSPTDGPSLKIDNLVKLSEYRNPSLDENQQQRAA